MPASSGTNASNLHAEDHLKRSLTDSTPPSDQSLPSVTVSTADGHAIPMSRPSDSDCVELAPLQIREVRAVLRTKRLLQERLDELRHVLSAAQGAIAAREYAAGMRHLALMAGVLGDARSAVGLLAMLWPAEGDGQDEERGSL